MSRLKVEQGIATLVTVEDTVVLGPIEMDLKSRDPFRFIGVINSGKATFRILGSLTETTYPGGGSWGEVRRFSGSDLEAIAFVEQEFPYIVVLADPTVEGISGNVTAIVSHLVGGDVGDFEPLAIAGGVVPGKHIETVLCSNDDVRTQWEDLWNVGGTRVIPNSPAQLNITTYSADDALGGVGANLVVLEGVINNGGVYELAVEPVALVGNGTVQSVNSYVFVHRAVVICGANRTNSDTIDILHNGNRQLVIDVGGANITHASHFYVPDGHRAYISHLDLTNEDAKRVIVEVQNFQPSLNCFVSSQPIYIGSDSINISDISVAPFESRNIIKIRARNLTGGQSRVSGRYTIILEVVE